MKNNQSIVWSGAARGWHESLAPLLDSADLPRALSGSRQVLIKPNLVEALAPPITTPVELVAALVRYVQDSCPDVRILVGEGTGSLEYGTDHCFEALGYAAMSRSLGIELIDLNREVVRHLRDESCPRWPEMHLPDLLFDSFLISVPVLKAHSLAQVTLSLKNMMGCAPPAHYQGGGSWGKSSFHRDIHAAIRDLNCYRTPDFTVLDASVGMARAHLWGPTCNPPVGRLAVAYDPVAIDAYGAALLQRSWRDIGHIEMSHGLLGRAEPLQIKEVGLVAAP